jgi:hypothetical protein
VASGRLVAAGKSYRLKAASRGLTAGRKRTLGLKLGKKARRAAAGALARHRSVSARITIVAAPGSRKTVSVKLATPIPPARFG